MDWHILHKEYLEGKTLKDIAKKLDCSYQCVRNNFKNRGLKIMTLSDAGLRSKRLKRGTTGRTRSMIKINGKRYLRSHYNWCVANNYPFVPKGFTIHHIDNNRHNDEPNNLALLPQDYHKSLHYHFGKIKNPDRIYWGVNQGGTKMKFNKEPQAGWDRL